LSIDVGSSAANRRARAHAFVPQLRRAFRLRPTFFAFYVGRGDARLRAGNERLHGKLEAARVPHLFKLYAGAHEQRVWNAHPHAWLALAVGHLAPTH
jgi:hypothetical protein